MTDMQAKEGKLNTEKAAKVFISYARQDLETAQMLAEALIAANFEVWFDKISLLPGETWENRITDAILSCDFFIACLSNESVNKRGYVQKELKQACALIEELPDDSVFVIPVRFDDCTIPRKFRHFHCIDLDPTPSGVLKIVNNLRQLLGIIDFELNEMPSLGWARVACCLVDNISWLESELERNGYNTLLDEFKAHNSRFTKFSKYSNMHKSLQNDKKNSDLSEADLSTDNRNLYGNIIEQCDPSSHDGNLDLSVPIQPDSETRQIIHTFSSQEQEKFVKMIRGLRNTFGISIMKSELAVDIRRMRNAIQEIKKIQAASSDSEAVQQAAIEAIHKLDSIIDEILDYMIICENENLLVP
jgi:hypothetical protein